MQLCTKGFFFWGGGGVVFRKKLVKLGKKGIRRQFAILRTKISKK
jgi:hypothetical protein